VDAGGTESGQTGNGPSDGDATAIEPPDAASDLPSPGPSEMSDASTLVSGSSSGTDAGSSSDSDVTGEQAPDDGAIGCGPASQCASQVTELESEGNMHVPEGSEVEYGHNPPASGPHYPVWAKFEAYDKVVPRSYWVHNLEHGGVVLLYGPNATQAEQDQLRAVYDQLSDFESCGTKFALLTPDPLLDDPIAVVAWTWVLEADCVDPTAINAFVEAHRGQGTEAVCGDGSFEP
jgi:hypothetical protein